MPQKSSLRLLSLSTLMLMIYTVMMQPVRAEDASSQQKQFQLHYDVKWGDTKLGTAIAQWTFDEAAYSFEGTVKTEGTLSYFYEFEGSNSLQGEIIDNRYRPSVFASKSVFDDETYTIDMSWPKGIKMPVFTVEPEPERDEIHPLRRATLRDVVDPYTAMLMGLQDLEANGTCDGKYRVFDGRRRSELYLKDFGTILLEAEQDDSYSGEAHICGSASKLIGGHKLDSRFDPDEALDFEKVKIYVGRPDGETLMPVRIEMSNFIGSITVRLNMKTSSFN